jgi:hypothetical protein
MGAESDKWPNKCRVLEPSRAETYVSMFKVVQALST